MFLEVKMQQDRWRWCNFKLNRKKTTQIVYLEAKKQQIIQRFRSKKKGTAGVSKAKGHHER